MWEEQICSIEQSQSANINSQDEEIELVTPPVFDNCTEVLSAKDHIARDLYQEGVCNASKKGLDCSKRRRSRVKKGCGFYWNGEVRGIRVSWEGWIA
ncbi:hypothetical protein Tco_0810294 [Tanacetum coccineum]